MPPRRRGSISLWQTELFIVVIIVAILILSASLSAGLKQTLTRMTETSELRNASALAQRLEESLPLELNSRGNVRDAIAEYRDIYGGGIWVYGPDGDLIASASDAAPTDPALESVLLGVMDDQEPHVTSDLRADGWVIASHPLGSHDRPDGYVITASSAAESAVILRSVRDRMWVTFWISLAVAGLLGFGFSALIGRQIRAMSSAAAAMAAGDFDQRLSTGLVPDEIQDLAESYNTMAMNLGHTFGELEESRRRIAVVVESMAEGLVACDANGVVQVMNAEAALLLGVDGETASGLPLEQVTGHDVILSAVRAALGGSKMTERIELGDRVALLHCTPLLAEADAVEGAVLVLADVTDQHRVEAAQRRFVADASHELRTPIAALKGLLELLEDGAKEVPEVRDDFIRTMQHEADRLARLVTDLLTLARLEAGNLTLEEAPLPVDDLLARVVSVMCALSEQAGVHMVADVSSPGLRVLGDRDRIVQVLLCFADNALRHSPAGSTIRLHASAEGRSVRLAVSDQGCGITAEDLDRVFERFYRIDSSRGGQGTGLGLAIAKEIVEAHGSAIHVVSQPEVGTEFSFELPAV
jgi:signal transduction histidine kinase